MVELRHIEDAIDRLEATISEGIETYAYLAGLTIKLELLKLDTSSVDYGLTEKQRSELFTLLINEIL